jgi:hypothetical protein
VLFRRGLWIREAEGGRCFRVHERASAVSSCTAKAMSKMRISERFAGHPTDFIRAAMFGGFMFRVLLTVVALCAASALAETPDTIDDTGVPKLPVFGPTMLRFKACSAGGRELDVQVKVINFSAGDSILPDGYVWATKEENAAAAVEVMKSVYGRHLSYMPDAIVEKDWLLSEITFGRDIVRGTDDKGNPEERRVSTGLRILLETKMALMAKGKYSGMSVNFEPQNTFVKLTDKECDPLVFRE